MTTEKEERTLDETLEETTPTTARAKMEAGCPNASISTSLETAST
jgi:hypothetical protein